MRSTGQADLPETAPDHSAKGTQAYSPFSGRADTLCRASSGMAKRKQKQKRLTPRQRKLKALIKRHGSVAQFARDLSAASREQVSWSQANNWIVRGTVSKRMVLHVHKLTGAPLEDLL